MKRSHAVQRHIALAITFEERAEQCDDAHNPVVAHHFRHEAARERAKAESVRFSESFDVLGASA